MLPPHNRPSMESITGIACTTDRYNMESQSMMYVVRKCAKPALTELFRFQSIKDQKVAA